MWDAVSDRSKILLHSASVIFINENENETKTKMVKDEKITNSLTETRTKTKKWWKLIWN